MRRIVSAILALLLAASCYALSPEQESAIKCLYRVQNGRMAGTGWLIGPHTIVTANHVAEEGPLYFVYNGERYGIKITNRDLKTDVAYGEVQGGYRKQTVLRLASDLCDGDSVTAFACFEEGLRVAGGSVTRAESWMPCDSLGLQNRGMATCRVYGGFSGGPIVNMAGEVIGMTTNNVTLRPGGTGPVIFVRCDQIREAR